MLNKLKIFSFIFFLIYLTGCFEVPTEFVAPNWDVDLSLPITNKAYTLEDAIENDTANIKWYDEGDNYGLLYYMDNHKLDPVRVEDNLTIESFETKVTQKIESIKINEVDPVSAKLETDRVFPGIVSGVPVIVPTYTSRLEVEFNKIDDFDQASFNSGMLEMVVENQLPVDVELSNSEIRNVEDNSPISEYSEKVYIEAGQSRSIIFDISESTILDAINLSSDIYTPGSGGNFVTAENDTALVLTGTLLDTEVESITALLPQQDPITDEGGFVFDETTEIASAEIKDGGFSLEVNNDMSLGINANLIINELYNQNGDQYSRLIHVPANEVFLLDEDDLTGWSIRSDFPTKELTYAFEITTEETNEPRTISANDSVAVDVDFQSIVFSSVTGKIKPTEIEIEETTFDLELNDFNSKFNYSDLVFDNPDIRLNLECSADIDLLIDGEVVVENDAQSEILELSNILIKAAEKTTVNLKDYGLEDLLNSFSKDLPGNFTFRGLAVVNPENNYGNVNREDSLVSSLDLEIPLSIGIAGGEIVDTVELELNDIDDEDVDNINFAEVFFEIENFIPVGFEFTGETYDSFGNFTLNLPPNYDSESLAVNAPSVDSQGNVTEPGVTEVSIKLYNEDVKKFFDSSEMIIHLKLGTAAENGTVQPVKFRIDDAINLKASVSAGYKVDLNN